MKPEILYDVALSFAGEDRAFVERVADCLRLAHIRTFYDRFEKVSLWGKDLYEHLSDVYQNQAEYCLLFISEDYARKLWTSHERRNAQARAFRENQEYILPIRLDDTVLPGIPDTVGYLRCPPETPQTIVACVLEKLGREASVAIAETTTAIPAPSLHAKKSKQAFDSDRIVYLQHGAFRESDLWINKLIRWISGK